MVPLFRGKNEEERKNVTCFQSLALSFFLLLANSPFSATGSLDRTARASPDRPFVPRTKELRSESCLAFAFFCSMPQGESLTSSISTAPATTAVVTVFVKLPRPGFVKTRLAAGVGAEKAAQFYRACAERTVDVICRCGRGLRGKEKVSFFFSLS